MPNVPPSSLLTVRIERVHSGHRSTSIRILQTRSGFAAMSMDLLKVRIQFFEAPIRHQPDRRDDDIDHAGEFRPIERYRYGDAIKQRGNLAFDVAADGRGDRRLCAVMGNQSSHEDVVRNAG